MNEYTKMANRIFADHERAATRVGVIVMDPEENCLALLRSPTKKNFPDTWGTPGGQIEAGETPIQTAIREFKEKAGGTLISPSLFYANRQNGWNLITFVGYCAEGFKPVLNDEHTDFKWVPFSKWPRPASPGMERILNDPHLSQLVEIYAQIHRARKSFTLSL